MTFPELLNEYLRRLHCTAGELAESSGLTQASLKRTASTGCSDFEKTCGWNCQPCRTTGMHRL